MKNNFIFMCLSIGMLSNGFYKDAFAMNATEQTAENQRQGRVLIKEEASRLIEEEARGSTELVIPEGYTSIAGFAFFLCGGLTSIVIPGSVKSIGDWGFEECTGLTEITMPNSVTSIGDNAFRK